MSNLEITEADMLRLKELHRFIRNEGGFSAPVIEQAIHWIKTGPELLTALENILGDVVNYGLSHPDGGRFECEHIDAAYIAIDRANQSIK